MFEYLLQKRGFWSQKGPSGDVVLSTRIRLARNIPSLSFPHRQEGEEYSLLESICTRFVADADLPDELHLYSMSELSEGDRGFLCERNVITPELETAQHGYAIMEENARYVILVNEEDHFRIQVIRPGFQPMECFELADRIDNELNRFIAYAYSDETGHLTACPSNAGTGLKVSALVHLPLLAFNSEIEEQARELAEKRIEVRGLAGKGLETAGQLYLVANQSSLGVSEVDIIDAVDDAVRKLIQEEDERRDSCLNRREFRLENRIGRAYGTLKFSRSIGYLEAVECLSAMRLGVILSLIKNIDLYKINDLLVNVQRFHLQRLAGRELAQGDECDLFRATYLKQQLE